MSSGTVISSKSLYMLRRVEHKLQNNLRVQQPVVQLHGCCRLKNGRRGEEIRQQTGLMLLAAFEEHAKMSNNTKYVNTNVLTCKGCDERHPLAASKTSGTDAYS